MKMIKIVSAIQKHCASRSTMIYVVCGIMFCGTLCGCNASKDVVYLQGSEYSSLSSEYSPATIKPGDFLSIIVNSPRVPELAQPFNMHRVQNTFVPGSTVSRGVDGGHPVPFEVNAEGYISYPYIGKLKVEGMTRRGLETYITNFLQQEEYINDPVVIVRFVERHITVLGEVKKPGVYEYENDRINILEALSMAGDMTIFGERRTVKLIRENEGKTSTHLLDITDRNLYNNPYFYLQQNDQIYVEPITSKANNRVISSLQTFGLSLTRIGIHIARYIRRFN